ncbi:MAG: LuxR C-terminal-related transcriptional regulator [Idiomarina sp.]|nr:LuxR C-terminal-related transcriptional regulator [Idiomarina sp.]
MSFDRILMVVLIFISGANISDLVADYQMQVASWHLIVEGITVVISTVAFIILGFRVRDRNKELKDLKEALDRNQSNEEQNLKVQRKQSTEETLKKDDNSYLSVKKSFKQWMFSPSEQEVALLLIKGLTFNEIAEVRNTKEKTVRQQASAIYSKSGLNGRNNLSAWLIDELLD